MLLDWIAKIPKNQDFIVESHEQELENQWRDIQLRSQTHPLETKYFDSRFNRSCLHVACTKKPPVAVVHALVQAAAGDYNNDTTQSSATLPDVQQQKCDKHGRTPLALAIANNASLDVIDYLLELGRATAAKSCSSHCLAAVQIADIDGLLPLHLACMGYDSSCQLELVQKLIAEYPQALDCTFNNDDEGKTDAGEEIKRRSPLEDAFETRASFDVVKLLVQHMKKHEQSQNTTLSCCCPLVTALECGGVLPEIILYLVQEYPSAVYKSRCKTRGHLPLWIATIDQQVQTPLPIEVYKALAPSREILIDDPEVNETILHELVVSERAPARLELVRYIIGMAPQLTALRSSQTGHSPLTLVQRQLHRLYTRGIHTTARAKNIWELHCILLVAAHYGCVLKKKRKKMNKEDQKDGDEEKKIETHGQQDDTTDMEDDDNDGCFVLHAAVAMGGPLASVEIALVHYSHQVALRDCNGDYPLFLAIYKSPFGRKKRDLILMLLNLFPEACNIPISDVESSTDQTTALHLAAETANNIHQDVWDKLIEANFMALRVAAGATSNLDFCGMFPFQIAACAKISTPSNPMERREAQQRRNFQFLCGDGPVKEDLYQVNSIYKLLRAAPELVSQK